MTREMIHCYNPDCDKMIELIRREGNINGRNNYCSVKCWGEFSPSMRRVCETNRIAPSKESLKILILSMRADDKMTRAEIAAVLGVSAKTLRVWCGKVGTGKL